MTPYYETEFGVLYHGDCFEIMKELPANSVDTVITDPPYGLGEIKNLTEVLSDWLAGGDMSVNKKDFMGKDWELPSPVIWREVFRILKPGGSALVFAGTRSFDLMAVSMRLAGFEIKDSIWHGHSAPFLFWNYGSGFPKSANISKHIDKQMGANRVVVGEYQFPDGHRRTTLRKENKNVKTPALQNTGRHTPITASASPESAEWEGWFTALKPAVEPIILAQKPNDGTYAENALKWGVAGLNIDGCRIGISLDTDKNLRHNDVNHTQISKIFPLHSDNSHSISAAASGRFPSNLLLSHHPECVCEGEAKVQTGSKNKSPSIRKTAGTFTHKEHGTLRERKTDTEGKETIEKWVCHPDCIVRQMTERAGVKTSGDNKAGKPYNHSNHNTMGKASGVVTMDYKGDSGYVSRYFKQFAFDPELLIYSGKASRRERNFGCDKISKKFLATMNDGIGKREHNKKEQSAWCNNNHPCVKPQSVLSYLSKLTATPDGGIVFDPFMGSGSTAVAAINTGRRFIGIEKEAEYCEIAKARIKHAENQHKQLEFESLVN